MRLDLLELAALFGPTKSCSHYRSFSRPFLPRQERLLEPFPAPENQRIRIPTIPNSDWSRNRIIEEPGTPGGWDDMHGWSSFIGGEGVMMVVGAGIGRAASAVDDAGQCANWVAKFVKGGCFVPGTLVTLSELPRDASFEAALWGEEDFSELHQADWLAVSGMVQAAGSSATVIATQPVRSIQVPIEQVPLGARVPTKNPKPWEYDDSLPEPDEATWAVVSLTVERTDGGVVDAELLRPREWIERYGIEAGQLLPLNIEELQIQGLARVNSVTAASRIAGGEGSAVTGRFITRQVDIIARIEVLGADGQVETIEGTTIHPVWSVDRDDWVPLGELEQGEQLLGAAGPASVLSHAILQRSTPVYNIEVHGEHVYQVGELGLLVHNECVYRAFDSTGDVIYVGITKSFPRRYGEHLRTKGIEIVKLTDGLTRDAARAAEQALINAHGLAKNGGPLINKINSIAANNPIYADATSRGLAILKSLGIGY